MRSSNCKHLAAKDNCKHYAKRESNTKSIISRTGSVIAGLIVAFSAVVIPGTTFIQNVEAVTNVKNAVFSIGDTGVYSSIIRDSCNPKEEKQQKQEKKGTAEKPKKKTVKKPAPEKQESAKATEPETAVQTEAQTTEAAVPATQSASASMKVAKNLGLISTTKADTAYEPAHITLSDYDRDMLERLVMGEAGSLGYTGCALVAQAVRDSMVLSNTSSVEAIISSYQYDGCTDIKPGSAAKKAVSFIFDNDGYAVQHRILYFYASDVVSNAWHESQNFIVSYGNIRFFDKW